MQSDERQAARSSLESVRIERFDHLALSRVFRGIDLDVRALQGGGFRCAVERLELGTNLLEVLQANLPMLVHGMFPIDELRIGCTLAAHGSGLLNGNDVPRASLNLFCEGGEIAYRTPPDFMPSLFRVTRAELQAEADARLGQPLALPGHGVLSMPPTGASIALADCIRATLAEAESAGAAGRVLPQEAAERLRDQLLDGYVRALAEGLQARAHAHALERRMPGRNELMLRIDAYWAANRQEPLNTSELCRITGRSERVLQYTFRELMGMSPQTWFAAMRLNEVQRDLTTGTTAETTVAEVAMRWGFTHLGRFSRDYRLLFDEHPRDTLRRCQPSGSVE